MVFPVVIHKEKNSDYGISVPDLPGCISAGETVDEALAMIREAIELHLEGLIEDGEAVPVLRTIDAVRAAGEYADATAFAVVQVECANLRSRAKRINITLPERILSRIDAAAKKMGETRSGLISVAASEYIGRHVS